MTLRVRVRLMWHVAAAVFATALHLAACEGCRSTPASRQPTATTLGSNVGSPTARLILLTDVAGALEPCGCTKDQLGGVGHFGAWVKRERVPGVVAAAGPVFFMDSQLDPQKADQDRAKADAIARVLAQLDFVAFAPGRNDWSGGTDLLLSLARESGAAAIVDSSSKDPPMALSVVREVPGTALRIGFVGYGQPSGSEPTENVEATIRRGAEQARSGGANVLIALAAVGRGEAKRIADAVPELTAVVVGSVKSDGDANAAAPEAERIGDVLIAQSGNHLQSALVLDLYVRESPQRGRILRFEDGTGAELASRKHDLVSRIDELHRKIAAWERDPGVSAADLEARRRDLARLEGESVALEATPTAVTGSFLRYRLQEIRESLGQDPKIDEELLDYYKMVDEHNRREFAHRLPPAPAPGVATYVGVDVCASCHAAARRVWDGTGHSRAYAMLSAQFKEFNLDCVSCHVTGYEKPGGSTVTHVERLRNVQCEVCHGPGSKHVEAPEDDAAIVARPAPSL
ncbi:MAG TPA: multiheme c-type cytochrome, partial [Polyangiaceae bacterium]|nr:multiheme c-type cytochrome [Polyangiaceae bacterium]